MLFSNPVIRGFHPDPSICRVGRDYYLVTSSFEYFPGVPVFHSRDLVNWTQIGHVLTRKSQLDLDGVQPSDGIWAPSIRFHGGLFYMTTTFVRRSPKWDVANFFVTAKDPCGPWSEPVYLDNIGVDPELFFDDSGKCYYVRAGDGINICEIDVATGTLLEKPRNIWVGTGLPFPEGPHVYKVDGLYYLLIAEGGTGFSHCVTIARAQNIYGPYKPYPFNPILTQKNDLFSPVQCTGHADLIQAHDGSWWAVFLGVRPQNHDNFCFHLGRETFLAPVSWTHDKWPIVGQVSPVFEGPSFATEAIAEDNLFDSFDDPVFSFRWNFLRAPADERISLDKRKGFLTLTGSVTTLDDHGAPAFAGVRQEHFCCTVRTLLEFDPVHDGEEAGLCVFMSDRFHYDIALSRCDGILEIIVRKTLGTISTVCTTRRTKCTSVVLEIRAERDFYIFSYSEDGSEGSFVQMAKGETSFLSSLLAVTFTGTYFGLYAKARNAESGTPAYFDWFRYEIQR